MRIGLTGGMGSGKTAVSNIFSRLGIDIVDADLITRDLCQIGKPAYIEILKQFGNNILSENQTLNRARLREVIFNNEEKKRQLEGILHPLVRQSIYCKLNHTQSPYCIAVIPLLVEANQYDYLDRVCVVEAEESTRLQRCLARDNSNIDTIQKIFKSQITDMERIKVADDVIDNNGSLQQLEQNVIRLHQKYLNMIHEAPA